MKFRTVTDRFLAKIEILPNGCWNWTSHTDPAGYARFNVGGESLYAHRYMYEQTTGIVPDYTDHACHNSAAREGLCPGGPCPHRRCVNPDHLDSVTNAENSRRSIHTAAGRTHCKRGHEYTPENTRFYKGKRRCCECRKNEYRKVEQ